MQPPEPIDQIYGAAFIPDQWAGVLEKLATLSGSASVEFLIHDGNEIRHGCGSELSNAALQAYIASGASRHSEHYLGQFGRGRLNDDHFHHSDELLTPEEFARHSVGQALGALGLGGQLVTAVPLPSGETLMFGFARLRSDGRHSVAQIAQLEGLRPHLARAGLLASRLGFERARGALAALAALDLPAALLDGQGRVREANALLTPELFDTRGEDRIVLGGAAAQALLAEALAGNARIRSIPLPPTRTRPACVAQIVPLADAVRDPFASATALLVLNVAGQASGTSDANILRALFDLTAAESRLAAALAAGVDLVTAAQQCGIQPSTARSYLERIFQKTGCHRQAELVLLLAGLGAVPVMPAKQGK